MKVSRSVERCKKIDLASNSNKTYLTIQKEMLLDYVVHKKKKKKSNFKKIVVIKDLKPWIGVKKVERVLKFAG